MCGINGFNFQDENTICKMNQSLSHRGPNGSCFHVTDNISLGHTRLSIIDLSINGSQPMFFGEEDNLLSIVFNGEIYNYLELKIQLIELGYTFKTDTDTEVILVSYLKWGEQCVNYFNGMWSFVIYDKKNNLFFCSRDRLGVKPFYYYHQNNLFIFSSEIKAIINHKKLNINCDNNINPEAIELYFSLGYIPSPLSIYKNIYKLKQGHNLIFDLNTNKIKKTYKYFNIIQTNYDNNLNNLIDECKYILNDSVKIRLRSDVPVGAFLSGGIDSSTIVNQILKINNTNLHTFSMGFNNIQLDESEMIFELNEHFKTNNHHIYYNEDDYNLIFDKYSNIYDEPFADYSSFPTYKLCKEASKKVTVVLSGDGGDEIFGGYPIYYYAKIIEKIGILPESIKLLIKNILKIIPFNNHNINKLKELINLSIIPKEKFYNFLFESSRYKPNTYLKYSESSLRDCLYFAHNSLPESLRLHDLLSNTLADNFLTKVDRSSMQNSIEVRSPFLDYRFINFAQKIPINQKYNSSQMKILLRNTVKNELPNNLFLKKKSGFTPPIQNWILSQNSKLNDALLLIERLDYNIYKFYTNNLNIMSIYYKNLFEIKLLIFADWYKNWINNEYNQEVNINLHKKIF